MDGGHFWGVLHPGHVLVKTNQHPHLRSSGGVSDHLDEGFFKVFSFVHLYFSIFVLTDYLNYFQIFVVLKLVAPNTQCVFSSARGLAYRQAS